MTSSASSSCSSSANGSSSPSSSTVPAQVGAAGAGEPNQQPSSAAIIVDTTDSNLSSNTSSSTQVTQHIQIKEEPDTDSYEPNFWAKIFEEGNMVDNLLEGDEDESMKSEEGRESATTHYDSSSLRATHHSPSDTGTDATLLEHWNHYDEEIPSSMTDFTTPTMLASSSPSASTASAVTALMYLPSMNLQPFYEEKYNPSLDATNITANSNLSSHRNHFQPGPSLAQTLVFKDRSDGTPYQLSKPIVREDGTLLVGTELIAETLGRTHVKNRIFVTNFRCHDPARAAASIPVEEEVRDLQWINAHTAIVAVGKDIHLMHVGTLNNGDRNCRLQAPINRVHSDSIREIAVSPSMNSCVLSGGFDETVVLTDLRLQGDPKGSSIVGKFDAYDVVSSVRWSPTDSQLSWTTDGGDFQVADVRARSAQLQVPLSAILHVDPFGGLFTHEYLSDHTIVLGFERGQLAFLDIRMPRKRSCYSVVQSPLTATGEIRRSKKNKFAVFGRGGFTTAQIDSSSRVLEQFAIPQDHHATTNAAYKTSGDFSYENGAFLATTDNMGVVSVYNDPPSLSSPSGDDSWRERLV